MPVALLETERIRSQHDVATACQLDTQCLLGVARQSDHLALTQVELIGVLVVHEDRWRRAGGVNRRQDEGRDPLTVLDVVPHQLPDIAVARRTVERRIELDEDKGTIGWVNQLPDDVPGVVKSLVGRTVRIELRFQVQHGPEWRVDPDGLDGRAYLRSDLRVEFENGRCRVHVDGDFRLSGGPLNVAARFEGQAWQELVKPIFVEDLLPLLCEED